MSNTISGSSTPNNSLSMPSGKNIKDNNSDKKLFDSFKNKKKIQQSSNGNNKKVSNKQLPKKNKEVSNKQLPKKNKEVSNKQLPEKHKNTLTKSLHENNKKVPVKQLNKKTTKKNKEKKESRSHLEPTQGGSLQKKQSSIDSIKYNTPNASDTKAVSRTSSGISKIKNAVKVILSYCKSVSVTKKSVSVTLGENMPDALKGAKLEVTLNDGVYKIALSGFKDVKQELSASKLMLMSSDTIQKGLESLSQNQGGVQILVEGRVVYNLSKPQSESRGGEDKESKGNDQGKGGQEKNREGKKK